jgi:competence protein ComEA
MKPWQHILIGILVGLLCGAVIYWVASPPRGTAIVLLPPPTPGPIMIDIGGAVIRPGVYALPLGSRVNDAITAAGGMDSEAAGDLVNLAHVLRDGEKIHIPYLVAGDAGQVLPVGNQNPSGKNQKLVNINTADQVELETLPGIGASRALDIINYRETHGAFLTLDDLIKVPGIGPVTLERIRLQITVEH